MNKYVSRGLWTLVLTGGFMALGVGVAHADTGTSGDHGVASGTQGILGIELPISLGGNSISLFGNASSQPAPASESPTDAPAEQASTSGLGGILNGTQGILGIELPISLGGNSISIFGDASSQPAPAPEAPAEAAAEGEPSSAADSATEDTPAEAAEPASTSGVGSLLGGTQVLGDLDIPVAVGGNAISVFGDASAVDTRAQASPTGGVDATATAVRTGGVLSLLGGTQLLADLGVPLSLGGNAISVFGDADAFTPSSDGDVADTTRNEPGDDTGDQPGDNTGDQPGDNTGDQPGDQPGDRLGKAPGGDQAPSDGDAPGYALASGGVSALASTGVDEQFTLLAMALLVMFAGGAMVLRARSRARQR